MRYVAAYMLATIGGQASPSEGDLKKILASVGIDCEADKAGKVLEALKDKKVDELMEEGLKKLSSVPSGGGGGGAPAAGTAAAAAPAEVKEEKKKEEEKDEESDEDMGFGLFD